MAYQDLKYCTTYLNPTNNTSSERYGEKLISPAKIRLGSIPVKTRNLIVIAIALSALFGLLGAYAVVSEPIAYIASMTFGILFLYLLIPLILILFLSSAAAASLKKFRYAIALFVSCLALPTFFLGGVLTARSLGWAQYDQPGQNDMRPIDEEPNGNIIIIYRKNSTFEEQQKLSNDVIYSYKKDVGFTDETGVQSSLGLLDIDGRVSEKIFFRASGTEEQKAKLRAGLDASPIVYRYFENLTESQVRRKFESKPTQNIQPPSRY